MPLRLPGRRRRRTPPRPPAAFIVGMNRSGTTLLRMMLDSHSQLAIPPETHFVPGLIKACNRGATPEEALAAITAHPEWGDFGFTQEEMLERLRALDRLSARNAVRAFFQAYAERAGKPRWGDKTPRYVLKMPLIQRALPEARFVHVIRDGRDVALSVLARTVREEVNAAEVARRWRRKIERARADAPRLRHYLEVRYEDLVLDPERALREVCGFLDLPFEEAMLRYHERSEERLVEMARPLEGDSRALSLERRMKTHAMTTRPPDASRVSRWRSEMSAADQEAFERVAGETLAELGYSTVGTPSRPSAHPVPHPTPPSPRPKRAVVRPSLAFLICVESGQLEQQAVLFARSVRRWAGRFAECPVHAYAPREGHAPASATVDALQELGVHVHIGALNRELAYYPFVNKVYAGVEAERTLSEDVLAFCDSDTVFIGEPAAFELPPAMDVALAPAFHVNKASTGPGHRLEGYWQRVYEIAGGSEPPYLTTAEKEKRIRGYWNAGLIVARREAGYFSDLLEVFHKLLSERHFPDGKMMVLDQIAMAGAVSRRVDRFLNLPRTYNYNIARRPFYKGALATADLPELVHLHYHQWFNRKRFLEDLRPPLDPRTPQYRWLAQQLPLKPAVRAPLPGTRRRFRWGGRGLERLRRPLRRIDVPAETR